MSVSRPTYSTATQPGFPKDSGQLAASQITVQGHAQAGMPTATRTGWFRPMSARELRRRCWHILPGFLPFVLWHIYHKDPLSLDCRAIILAVMVAIAGAYWIKQKTVARSGESHADKTMSVLGYTCSTMATLLLFPAQAELGFTVFAITTFGDGFATLAGMTIRGPALPWNSEKSWVGTIAFALFAVPMATIVYWGEARPSVPLSLAFVCAAPAALVAAAAESVRSRIDDNVRVGVAAALTVIVVNVLIFW